MLIMLVSFHLFNALWEMYVFYQQWTLIFDNLTANEFINGTKYFAPSCLALLSPAFLFPPHAHNVPVYRCSPFACVVHLQRLRRYAYFRDRENRFRNPFDKGWKANLQDFLHPKIDYTDLFEVPYTDDSV
jgi:hypothetical protein